MATNQERNEISAGCRTQKCLVVHFVAGSLITSTVKDALSRTPRETLPATRVRVRPRDQPEPDLTTEEESLCCSACTMFLADGLPVVIHPDDSANAHHHSGSLARTAHSTVMVSIACLTAAVAIKLSLAFAHPRSVTCRAGLQARWCWAPPANTTGTTSTGNVGVHWRLSHPNLPGVVDRSFAWRSVKTRVRHSTSVLSLP